jgi:aryl-alcohol dehydrogenase-like predicted oxidoreductase
MAQRPGPYRHLRNERVFSGLERLAALAAERSVDTAALALAWVLAQEAVSAIVVGPRRPEHLSAAAKATSLGLTPDEADEIAALF